MMKKIYAICFVICCMLCLFACNKENNAKKIDLPVDSETAETDFADMDDTAKESDSNLELEKKEMKLAHMEKNSTVTEVYAKAEKVDTKFMEMDFEEYRQTEGIISDFESRHIYWPYPCGIIEASDIFNNKIYYSTWSREKENVVEIYSFDLNSEIYTLLYQYTVNEENEFYWFNELQVNENYLFWVQLTVDGRWVLKELDLKNKETRIIREYEEGMQLGGISITLTDQYIFWYEVSKEHTDYLIGKIVLYDIEKKTLEYVENVFMHNPYIRVATFNDQIAYFTLENNRKVLNISNIEKRKTTARVVMSEGKTGMISGFNDYFVIIYDNKNMHSNIYLYQFEENSYIEINNPDLIFWADEYDGKVFINHGSQIYFLDIDNKYKVHLEKKEAEANRFDYTFPRRTYGSNYIIHFFDQEGSRRGFYVITQ
ncbi:hypothetical protein JYU11_01345 [bacterium AH-315-G05]|nr:hypothetical protein [bacterium AH-315-G05]